MIECGSCGFKVDTHDAVKIYQEHKCPGRPTPTAAIMAILVAMVSAIVLVTWIIAWAVTQ